MGLVLPEDLPYDKWLAMGTRLRELHAATPWMIGDWLAYGISHFSTSHWGGQVPHGLAQEVANSLGLAPQTVWNYKSVCAALPPSRRREGVTMQHALEVVSKVKDAKAQDRIFADVVENKTSVKAVREQLRAKAASVPVEKGDTGTSSILETARQFVRDFNAAGELTPGCKQALYLILTPVMDRLT